MEKGCCFKNSENTGNAKNGGGGVVTLPIFFVYFTVCKFVKILAFLGKWQEKDALKVYGGHTFRWLEVKFYIFGLSNNKFV